MKNAVGVLSIGVVLSMACCSWAVEGTETIVKTETGKDKKGRQRKPAETPCWLPKGCKYVRGVVVGHPMIGSLATEDRFRKVAAEEDLGTMLIKAFTWDVGKNWKVLDEILEKWAKETGHPELKGAPVFVSGLSASVLMARLLVYEKPERCFGIIHAAGGNMHQHYPKGKTLSGVPFMAANGEYESCGPEAGIRPHLGFDTQWYLQGEQMLERRREDPNHLMCMVTIPVKGHTAWSKELGELFIRKCAKYRIPKEKRDGSKPAKCIEIKAEDGWLTHRNVKYPKHPPAAWADYKGDKKEAFWHLDEEMAMAVRQYHQDGKRSGQDRTLFRPYQLFNKLWPLPQRMDIPFKGDSPEDYAKAIKEWITKKAPGEVDPVALDVIAESIASGLKKNAEGKVDEGVCRKMCLRVLYPYHDAYLPVERAIAKTKLSDENKDKVRRHYADLILKQYAYGKTKPKLSVREMQAAIATLPSKIKGAETIAEAEADALKRSEKTYGKPPEELAKLIRDLGHKDWKIGWGAVDKIAALGKPAIPVMVRTMEWVGKPFDMRAAGALGKMGKVADPALPDLERFADLGGKDTEHNGLVNFKVLEAIKQISGKDFKESPRYPQAIKVKRSLKLVRASFLGTAGDDDIQGCSAGPDGSIYIAGNTGESQKKLGGGFLGGGVKPTKLGKAVADPKVGHAFVARLSKDGGKVLAYAELGKGIASFTTVKANKNGVYVSGYASDGLEPLLKDIPGAIKDYPLDKQVQLLKEGKWTEAVGEKPGRDPIPESKNKQLGRYGAPCVLRLSADLKKLEGGSYLEGWQQVWAKGRCISTKPVWKCWPTEYSWQPTVFEMLESGDIVVGHDGGYFRILTDEDRALVKKVGHERLAHRLGFYHVCDHLSRLKPDLGERVYHTKIYTPATDPEVAKEIKNGWPYPHYSNPRIHRMCLDREENIYICGWSATATSRESWWSYFLWKMNSKDGSLIKKIMEKDPMSGPNHRMHGAVADRGIHACAVSEKNIWHNSYSDGGWSGLIHFSGTLYRHDRAALEEKGSARTGPCYWITDMEALPDEHLLTVGRCNYRKAWPKGAWQGSSEDENPVAWISVYDDGAGEKAMQPSHTSAIRGILPYELAALGDGRYMLVGQSVANVLWKKTTDLGPDPKNKRRRKLKIDITPEPNQGVAVVKDPLYEKHRGGADGYFMIVEWE